MPLSSNPNSTPLIISDQLSPISRPVRCWPIGNGVLDQENRIYGGQNPRGYRTRPGNHPRYAYRFDGHPHPFLSPARHALQPEGASLPRLDGGGWGLRDAHLLPTGRSSHDSLLRLWCIDRRLLVVISSSVFTVALAHTFTSYYRLRQS